MFSPEEDSVEDELAIEPICLIFVHCDFNFHYEFTSEFPHSSRLKVT